MLGLPYRSYNVDQTLLFTTCRMRRYIGAISRTQDTRCRGKKSILLSSCIVLFRTTFRDLTPTLSPPPAPPHGKIPNAPPLYMSATSASGKKIPQLALTFPPPFAQDGRKTRATVLYKTKTPSTSQKVSRYMLYLGA